ncbi:DUF3325 domain-containing protein [Roseomonas populi]|uniref:DUF3325 domain-containing protein n=1 Tax=Roseomonas populi TaxID=3121582 RepID=A0ABT1XAN5_9PROT|nr:DUF3325 domain-containing protein [Roseomonas pecuniae]MCR0985183.1 DUF3325 domain-containing protein [Roseomonas pecuniae]
MIAFAAALSYAGFTALCLAMARHHEQVFRSRAVPAGRRRVLTALGWGLLALSVVPVVMELGWGLGLVLWLGLLTATAMPLAMLLNYAPRVALALAVTPVLTGIGLLL